MFSVDNRPEAKIATGFTWASFLKLSPKKLSQK
jgi:hypothetical protein